MPNKKQKQSKQKGLTLIGLLVGGAIIGITFTSGLTLISRNIRFSSVTAHEIAASALAEEGVELIRNIRDTGDNYCIKEASCNCETDNGFTKIDKNDDYALDYTTSTYTCGEVLDDKVFDDNNAGLCLDDNLDNFYYSCKLSPQSPNLKFIRKINLNKDDSECGEVLVTVTVYWTEFWEGTDWPNNINNISDDLHKVQVKKCMYDWRPR